EDDAFGRAAVADERRGDRRQVNLLALARNRDVLRGRLGLAAARAGEELAKRLQIGPAEYAADRLSDNRAVDAQEARGRAVDRRDQTRRVHRHDAGRDALENGLDVASPAFDLLMLALELDRRSLDLAP